MPSSNENNSNLRQQVGVKNKRNPLGMPDPDVEVIALSVSPKILMPMNRFVCKIYNRGFKRDQNLQLHRRDHNLPLKLKKLVSPDSSAWVGKQLFMTIVVCKPVHVFLDEISVPYDKADDFVVVKHATLFTCTIMRKVLASRNVKLFNPITLQDLIIKENHVSIDVTNWALVLMNHNTQLCMDLNMMEAKVVVNSCGHDGPFGAINIKRFKSVKMIDTVPGMEMVVINEAP